MLRDLLDSVDTKVFIVDWWNTFESTFSANTAEIPANKTFQKSNTGDYIINLELAADKHAEISKIKLENSTCEWNSNRCCRSRDVLARNYQLTRNIRIEMGSDPYDWLANNFINLGPHTFDGCGNSITINNSYGIIDGV